MSLKKLALAATAVISAASLGACSTGEGIDHTTQGVTAAAAQLSGATFDAQDCAVQGMSRVDIGGTFVMHDFANSVTALRKSLGGVTHNYSISFNDVTNPSQQARITAAHALLPAAANCPAPVFAAPATGA